MKFLKKAKLIRKQIGGCLRLGMDVSGSWVQTGLRECFCGGGKCSKTGLWWLVAQLFKFTKTHWIVHLKWVGFKKKKRVVFMVGIFYTSKNLLKKSTIQLGLQIYLNQNNLLSPHHRPVLPLTWALPLMPTNNKDSLLQNWKTKTGKNAGLSQFPTSKVITWVSDSHFPCRLDGLCPQKKIPAQSL